MYLFYFSCVECLINLILYLWNTIESDIIKIWFYIKNTAEAKPFLLGTLTQSWIWIFAGWSESYPSTTSNITHTADWRKSAFFPLPFFFLILHNWRAWIIYNSQIIFWMVSATGRQRGNFNDVPSSAELSFTVSQPEKLPAEYHLPSHWS